MYAFIISTHSENIVATLLGLVASKELSPDQIACYLCQKTKDRTILQRQLINSKGQIEGGLTSFLEVEIENLKPFLGIKE